MIITFYSYKGGVGRSMALANVGEVLASRGYRVIVCDWDLEAPGLERYFTRSKEESEHLGERPGVIDLLLEYKHELASQDLESPRTVPHDKEREFARVGQLILRRPSSYLITVDTPPDPAPSRQPVRLLTAGRRAKSDSSYSKAVQQFDWSDFYTQWAGDAYIEFLRKNLDVDAKADFVLIDSRTGVTEQGGVCTHHLADAVVLVTGTNDQNLNGAKWMHGELFENRELERRRGNRPLDIIPVAARVEDRAEKDQYQSFLERFNDAFATKLPEALSDGAYLNRAEIPYVSFYSYEERVVAREPRGKRHLKLLEAYESVADAIVACAVHRGHVSMALGSRPAAAAPIAVMTNPAGPFVLANGHINRDVANQLAQGFERVGVALRTPDDGAHSIWAPGELDAALLQSAGAIVLVGQTGLTRDVEAELDFHVRRSVERDDYRVVPVLTSDAPAAAVPSALSRLELVSATAGDAGVVRQVIRALGSPRRPSMEPPAISPFAGLQEFSEGRARYFFGRDAKTTEMVERIGPLGGYRVLIVEGDSGSGKSSLVAAGLIPTVRRLGFGGSQTTIAVGYCRPAADPLEALADALRAACVDGSYRQTSPPNAATLRTDPDSAARFVGEITRQQRGLLIVVDPVTKAGIESWNQDAAEAFSTALAKIASTPDLACRIVLVIGGDATGVFAGGADTIGRLTALAEAVERVGSRYGVDALTRGELEKVFELIARAAGCTWESDLLTRLLNDVGRTAQAMAHAGLVASELWQRQTHGMLTHAAYGEIGGVGGVLSRAADAAIEELDASEREMAWEALLTFVQVGRGPRIEVFGASLAPLDDVRAVSSQHALNALGGATQKTLKVLTHLVARARIVALSRDGVLSLARGPLIREWQALKDRVDAERQALALRDTIEEAASTWSQSSRRILDAAVADSKLTDALTASRNDPSLFSATAREFLLAARQRRWLAHGAIALLLALIAGFVYLGQRLGQKGIALSEADSLLQVKSDSLNRRADSAYGREVVQWVGQRADSAYSKHEDNLARLDSADRRATELLQSLENETKASASLRNRVRRLSTELTALKAARDTADAQHDTLIAVLRTDSARLRAQVVRLERELARLRPQASTQAPASQPPRGRLLWVDDDPKNNASEMATLRGLGFAIETAISTDQAVVALDRLPADVIVSAMSRGTDDRAGLLLVAQLRGKRIETPVIFYVGTVTEARRQEAAKVGVRVTSSPSELARMVSSVPRR